MNVSDDSRAVYSCIDIPTRLSSIVVLVLVTLLIIPVTWSIYNVFFHPLKTYPGPVLWASSTLPWLAHRLGGYLHFRLVELHDRYGPVVRVAPNELSYIDDVWKTIYGHNRGEEMEKDHVFGNPPPPGCVGLLTADRTNHARMRRLLAHAFSEKALREQESYLQLYVDKLVMRLKGECGKGALDIVSWLNFTTFDLVGDLAFGEPFGCLEVGKLHPWIGLVDAAVKQVATDSTLRFLNLLPLKRFFIPPEIRNAREDVAGHAMGVVDKRLATEVDRKDFISYIQRYNDEKGMTRDEIHTNADLLIIAGSETTATLLAGAFYNLMRNREAYDRLVAEVRGAFEEDGGITLVAVNELKYMLAVLDETLRVFPPVPISSQRIVPRGGEMINGAFVPRDVRVGIPQYAANHSLRNFHEPDKFLPERWLLEFRDRTPFANDNRSVVQPFSFGPRSCLGRNLAYAEMRLILAKLLFHFDFELQEGYEDWQARQKTHMLWDKTPLLLSIKPVVS